MRSKQGAMEEIPPSLSTAGLHEEWWDEDMMPTGETSSGVTAKTAVKP